MLKFGAFTNLSQSSGEGRLNWGHPMSPRSKNGLYVPFNTPGIVRDLVLNRNFTNSTGGVQVNWVPSGFPYGHNHLGFQMQATPQATYFNLAGAQNPSAASGNWMMMACVYLGTSAAGDGNRVLSNGNDVSMVLEPCRSGVFNVLSGGIAHNNTGLSTPLNQWQFSAACVKSSTTSSAVVYNYTTGKSQATTFSMSSLSSTDGSFYIGTNSASTTKAAPGITCFCMIDYAYWSTDDMLRLAQDPWAALEVSSSKSTFIWGGIDPSKPSGTLLSSSNLTASGIITRIARANLTTRSTQTSVATARHSAKVSLAGLTTISSPATVQHVAIASLKTSVILLASSISYVNGKSSLAGVTTITSKPQLYNNIKPTGGVVINGTFSFDHFSSYGFTDPYMDLGF